MRIETTKMNKAINELYSALDRLQSNMNKNIENLYKIQNGLKGELSLYKTDNYKHKQLKGEK